MPIHISAIPASMSARSSAFAFRFFSLNIIAPLANDIITELRRTRDTTEIIDPGSWSEVRYAKSAVHMNMDIRGMAQLQWNGVP